MSESSTTVFDADAFATEPPEIRIGGRVYRGRILSIVEWTPFLDRFLATTGREVEELVKDDVLSTATMQASHQFCAEYLRAVLPRRWPRPDPVALLEARGSRMLKQAFANFFAHQCHAMGVALRTPTATATPQPPVASSPSPANDSTSPIPPTPPLTDSPGKTAVASGDDAPS